MTIELCGKYFDCNSYKVSRFYKNNVGKNKVGKHHSSVCSLLVVGP